MVIIPAEIWSCLLGFIRVCVERVPIGLPELHVTCLSIFSTAPLCGLVSGVTGGLAAPLVAAGAGAVIGAGGAAALGSATGIAIMASLFGAAGAGLTGRCFG